MQFAALFKHDNSVLKPDSQSDRLGGGTGKSHCTSPGGTYGTHLLGDEPDEEIWEKTQVKFANQPFDASFSSRMFSSI